MNATVLLGPKLNGPQNPDGTINIWTYDTSQIDESNPWKLPKIAQVCDTNKLLIHVLLIGIEFIDRRNESYFAKDGY